MELTLSDQRLNLTVRKTEQSVLVQLEDRATGRRFPESRLARLEIHDRPLRREDVVDRLSVDAFEKTDQGIHVVLGDTSRGVQAGFWLRLFSGELSVLLYPPEIYESRPLQFRLFAVDLLPELTRVEGGEARLLLPVNGATICRPAGKPRTADRFMIYLEQPRWELSSMLPIAGTWDASGGLMSLATRGAPETECRVSTDGDNAGRASLSFSLRRHWPDPLELSEREIRFVPFGPKDDAVHFIAKRLRRHAVEDHGKKTLKQRAAESPEVAYLLAATKIKLFHGMENVGAAMYQIDNLPTSFINTMTFAEALDCLRQLHALGIDRIHTQSVGWNARGHDGMYPTRFPVERRLGGEEGLRRLIAEGQALGYMVHVHDNFQMQAPQAPDWHDDWVSRDIYGEPLLRGYWAGGLEYGAWPSAFPREYVEGHLDRMKSLGLRGMYYCDYWMPPLEVNYHPRHRGSRTEHQRGVLRVLEAAKEKFGAVGTEFGTFPGAMACDSIASHLPHGFVGACKSHPDWPVAALLDEPAPVYALALHGLVTHHAMGGPSWHNAVMCIGWGALPRDEWGVRPIKMGGINVFTTQRARALKALHDLCVKRFGHLASEEMTRCVQSADGGVLASFADGTIVQSNPRTMELSVNGKTIEKPADLL